MNIFSLHSLLRPLGLSLARLDASVHLAHGRALVLAAVGGALVHALLHLAQVRAVLGEEEGADWLTKAFIQNEIADMDQN